MITSNDIDDAYKAGKQAGIKEVVDWVMSESDYDCGHFIFGFDIDQDIWNAKLKEWGINL